LSSAVGSDSGRNRTDVPARAARISICARCAGSRITTAWSTDPAARDSAGRSLSFRGVCKSRHHVPAILGLRDRESRTLQGSRNVRNGRLGTAPYSYLRTPGQRSDEEGKALTCGRPEAGVELLRVASLQGVGSLSFLEGALRPAAAPRKLSLHKFEERPIDPSRHGDTPGLTGKRVEQGLDGVPLVEILEVRDPIEDQESQVAEAEPAQTDFGKKQ
jgi:hypothetical protein